MDPGALIRRVRQRHGLTQADVARLAGTSQPVISAYERGRRDPTFGTLRRLIEVTGERLRVDAVIETDLPPPADEHEHAARLLEVLSLADAIPARRREAVLTAPRLVSM